MAADESDSVPVADKRHFATTHWSIVLAAGDIEREDAQGALAQLCESYWYPLYAYVRRRGYSVTDAQDATQAFFTHLLEKQSLRVADPQRGWRRSITSWPTSGTAPKPRNGVEVGRPCRSTWRPENPGSISSRRMI